MTIHVTATELRKNVYRLLDRVADSGEVVEVVRNGKRLRIEQVSKGGKLDSLQPHHGCISGNPDDLVHMDWSESWQPDL